MDPLRIALLVAGLLVVVAVYFTSRKRDSAEVRNSSPSDRVEPSLSNVDSQPNQPSFELGHLPSVTTDEPDLSAVADLPSDPPSSLTAEEAVEPTDDPSPQAATSVTEKVITLRIVSKKGGDFSAEKAILALRDSGLSHGRFGIFHKLFEDKPDGETVFAAANLVEPGSFDLKNLRDQRLPGLSFFLVRPGPGRGVDGYDKMVEIARSISINLEGELVDGDGSTFSIQRERFLREELIQYELDNLNL